MVKNMHTSDHPAAQMAGATIASLFAEWLEVREKGDNHERYAELQEIIVDHMAPVSAKDLAMQFVVETDHGDADWRSEFKARLLAFAKRPPHHRPINDKREAKWSAALDAFGDAAREYDPTILSLWICHSEGDEPGAFTKVDAITFNRSRASENRTARARGEIA